MCSQPRSNHDKSNQEKLAQLTSAALREQDRRFAREHGSKSDEWLLAYVRRSAAALGATPYAYELVGGPFIARRFGDWDKVLSAAGLPPCPQPAPGRTATLLFKKEFQRQASLRRKALRADKAQREKVNQEKRLAARQEREALIARDMAWGAAHEADSDEALLDYLRRCAEELGHSPTRSEVLGGFYIKERIGGWPLALALAGLPLPADMKPPKEKDILAYRRTHPKRETE